MFTGFKSEPKFPEYEVIAPQSGQSFTLRSLTVQEEEHMKASMITPLKIIEHLNRCIFNALVQKPETITDFDSFLKNVTIKDRDALLYGLSHCTYGDERSFDLKCNNCGKSFSAKTNLSSCFDAKFYPNDDILKKRVPVELKVTKGVKAIIKQPTCYDELFVMKNLSAMYSKKSVTTESLMISQFEDLPEEATEPIIYSERTDIIDAYLSLPPLDKRQIYKTYIDEFGQYQITLKMIAYCPECGESSEYDLDLADNFFQMVFGI